MPSDPRSRARPPGQRRHRRFGHAVDGCAGKAAAIRRDAAKGDNAAASTHVADRGLHGGKNGADIDREHPIEIGKLLFFDGHRGRAHRWYSMAISGNRSTHAAHRRCALDTLLLS
jgi:predicted RNA-binding Zn ribbon-like protein